MYLNWYIGIFMLKFFPHQLTAQLGKIGGNLNQIARFLNEHGTLYNSLSSEVPVVIADLADLKFEIQKKVGDAVGDVQTFKL